MIPSAFCTIIFRLKLGVHCLFYIKYIIDLICIQSHNFYITEGDKSFIAHCAAIKTMNFNQIIKKKEVTSDNDISI